MMQRTKPNKWKAELKIEGIYAPILYNSLRLEEPANPDRSLVELRLEDKRILYVSFNSKDFNALRASLMSYLKWIYVSEKIIKELL
ncbi:MAG: hypothetical protein DRN30_01950 [Thermoplasmata archaeon]|nr:hypothetical protein [Euryarchaeota archaeon]RLF66533.1 MAG: hypothetical protein DRN30_01950 [Thermoplasmata archaeon]